MVPDLHETSEIHGRGLRLLAALYGLLSLDRGPCWAGATVAYDVPPTGFLVVCFWEGTQGDRAGAGCWAGSSGEGVDEPREVASGAAELRFGFGIGGGGGGGGGAAAAEVALVHPSTASQ